MTSTDALHVPELGLELVRERVTSRLPRWDPRLWGRLELSENTRPGDRLRKLGLAWGRERLKVAKLLRESVTPESEKASDSSFTGKEEDIEVGLVYFGKRFYSPYLGRWVSPDPLAVHEPGAADLNLYAYVRGQALKAIDPLGLEDVVSAQAESEYRGGARGVARLLAAALGVSKVGTHRWTSGLVAQVRAEGKVHRIDSLGHTGSGLVSGDRRPGNYTLSSATAKALAPHLERGATIVIHGCGTASGRYANTRGFLEALPEGTRLYNHDKLSQPGQAFNWVSHTLVKRSDGTTDLVSRKLSGDDRVVDTILPREYVENWAKVNAERNPTKFQEWLGDVSGQKYRITNDVRDIMKAAWEARAGAQSGQGATTPATPSSNSAPSAAQSPGERDSSAR
jgi:RHS repeat-associated protein